MLAYANIYPLLTMWFTIITYSFEARHPNHLKMHHCCLATDKVPILRPAMQIISNSVWSFLLNKQNHRQNPKLVPLFILIFSSKSSIHISENLTKLAVCKKNQVSLLLCFMTKKVVQKMDGGTFLSIHFWSEIKTTLKPIKLTGSCFLFESCPFERTFPF